MRDTLRALLTLQEVDRDLWKAKDELRRLPQERQKRRAELDQKQAQLKAFDATWALTKTRVKEIEDLTTIHRQRMRKLEHEANNSRDAALHVAVQHEMRTLKREISEAEEEGLKLVTEIESLDKRRAELRASLETEELEFAEFEANVEKELASATARANRLAADRKSRMSTTISPELVSRYEALLASRDGQALAELDGRICQGCYINVPPNVFVRLSRGVDLVQCPSCDRILYLKA